MIGALVGIGLPALAAWIAARRLSSAPVVRWDDFAMTLAIAFGLASVVWPGLLLLGAPSRAVVLTGDVIVWVAIISALTLSRRTIDDGRRDEPRGDASVAYPRSRAIAAMLILLPIAALAIASFTASSAVAPHGEWDAWAQWNLRARFFFRGVAGEWRHAFAPVLAWSHPDYPPLVSASVARAWLYGGGETVLVPILFAAGCAAAIVVAAGASIGRVHGTGRACLTAAAILACPSFVRYAPAQCADIPLAAFMLLAFVATGKAAGPAADARWWWGTAGMSAALAAWTKNEGAAFFVVFTLAAMIAMVRARGFGALRSLAPFALGAAPVLIALLVFKRVLAPPSYFVAEQSLAGALSNLLTAARVYAVAIAMGRELWFSGAEWIGVLPAMGLVVVTRGIARPADAGARAAWPVMGVMILVYMAAYLVSPKDLGWQLATSLDRIVVQMVPTIVWAAMMIAR